MSIRIVSNGSKWMGQEPDNLETLLKVLAEHTLDPTFEDYGDFFYYPTYDDPAKNPPPDERHAWGNFWDVSHVFSVFGTAAELEPLRAAIEANKRTPAYKTAKDDIERRKRLAQEARERRAAQDRADKLNTLHSLQRELGAA